MRCYAWPSAPGLFVDDISNPYDTPEDRPFVWLRTHGLGGRVAVPLHGRQYLRHSLHDFRPSDGLTPDWPFEPDALNPFYEQVERRLGLSGRSENAPLLPDSYITHPREPDEAEQRVIDTITGRYPAVVPVLGRHAPPLDAIGDAASTGNLRLRQGAIAAAIEPASSDGITGVRFFDRETGGFRVARAPLVMLGAGSLESTRILLNSASERFPGGIGARSGLSAPMLWTTWGPRPKGSGPTWVRCHQAARRASASICHASMRAKARVISRRVAMALAFMPLPRLAENPTSPRSRMRKCTRAHPTG